MKRFLITSAALFVGSLCVVIAVYVFLVRPYLGSDSGQESVEKPTKEAIEAVVTELASTTGVVIPEAGLPVADIPLDSAKERALSLIGVDPETFVISQAMVACGVEKLGVERMGALASGEAPTLEEIAILTPCVKSP